ncbi:MAG TPA: ComEC/Rec2 family competence protein [Xanthobacteraceae bacterium]|jgi:competence protein ComEC|nr:ComEC/Rec2 family competence protein [Xanthobacteraceae bacterium]
MSGRRGARERAATWPPRGPVYGPALPWRSGWPWFAAAPFAPVRLWLAEEVGPGRLIPWLPIAFGSGILVYFAAQHEPIMVPAPALALAFMLAAILARARPIAFPLLVAATAACAGFATATVKSTWIAHPVLHHAAGNVAIAGWVETREERERTDRIVVKVERLESARRLDDAPDRVRLSVRKGTAPMVGAFIEIKARLNAPLAPLRPGGYDFARDLYFQGIGATGFAVGEIKTVAPPRRPGVWLVYAAFIESMRDSIDRRIRAAVPGDAGSIASALITGKRDAISAQLNDAMYISSLAHILSISGYHMAVVAGAVFFLVRAVLAIIPGFAARRPIKKWAALAALAAATFYLLLSGAEVATQRSYYMTAIVLGAVLIDRQALTLRTIGTAAVLVLLIAPEAVVHPSFQMSFAATLALIAAYERGLPWKTQHADTPLGARIALWGVYEVAGLIFASLVAGLGTTPYAAYHFHRMAPYGVLANLLAMPIVSAWIMPAGMLALLAMPFGLDDALWRLMGMGIDWMDSIALWVASLPGAVGRVPAFGGGPLLLCTAGLVMLCLMRSPLRWSGALAIVAATLWALATPLPDVLIAPSGDLIAVRGADGRLAVIKKNGEGFAVKEWLAADADPRTTADPTLGNGVACDAVGCTARLADRRIVALALTAEAFAEDCRRAVLVVSSRSAPPDCPTATVDRAVRMRSGALALRRVGDGWQIAPARPDGYERPWAKARMPAGAPPATAEHAAPSPKPNARDATPKPTDLAPDD